MNRLLVGLVALAAVGCAAHSSAGTPAPSDGTGRDAVMQADRNYAAATAARRLEGWMSSIAADAVKVLWSADFVKGAQAIRLGDTAMFADSTFMLEWKPTDGGVYSDGRYGYTKGRYEAVRTVGGSRSVVGRGTYLTVWRYQSGGWKVVLDTGVPDSRQ